MDTRELRALGVLEEVLNDPMWNEEQKEMIEEFMINLRKITEENFIDAFHLKLAPGRNALFHTQFAGLHMLMFTESNASLSEYMKATPWLAMLW